MNGKWNGKIILIVILLEAFFSGLSKARCLHKKDLISLLAGRIHKLLLFVSLHTKLNRFGSKTETNSTYIIAQSSRDIFATNLIFRDENKSCIIPGKTPRKIPEFSTVFSRKSVNNS